MKVVLAGIIGAVIVMIVIAAALFFNQEFNLKTTVTGIVPTPYGGTTGGRTMCMCYCDANPGINGIGISNNLCPNQLEKDGNGILQCEDPQGYPYPDDGKSCKTYEDSKIINSGFDDENEFHPNGCIIVQCDPQNVQ